MTARKAFCFNGGMKTLNRGFSPLSNEDLYSQGTLIVSGVGANAKFSGLSAKLPPITAAVQALGSAMLQPAGPVREANLASARATLIELLQLLADSLELVSGVTEADLAGTHFVLRKTATHTSAPPDAPQNVRLKSTGITGQLQITMGKVPRAVFYEVEWAFDPVAGPWTMVPAFSSTRGMVLEGLTRGKDYFVRVRAVATGQNRGPWSDIANAMAV